MDGTGLDQYIVPTTDTLEVRAKGSAATGGGMPSRRTMLIAGGVIVVLAILVVYLVWRKRYHSKPNCGGYKGVAGIMCQDVVAACKNDGACLNAAAHCLPIASKLSGASDDLESRLSALAGFSERQLSACASSIARVDPKLVTAMTPSGTCVPPELAAGVKRTSPAMVAAGYNVAANVINAGRPLAPWAVRVAQSYPACPPKAAPAPAAPASGTVTPP